MLQIGSMNGGSVHASVTFRAASTLVQSSLLAVSSVQCVAMVPVAYAVVPASQTCEHSSQRERVEENLRKGSLFVFGDPSSE